MKLRDYQRECVDAIEKIERGSGLICMATGLGKTVVFSSLKRRGRVLIISHRDELVKQPLAYYDCSCGVERGEEHSRGEEVVSASVQSLCRRLNDFKPDDFDLIITDEAHHAAAPSYKKIYEYFKPRLHIGFTATPNRGDKVRLDDVFERIIFQRDLKWGIKNGWLCDVRCIRAETGYDLKNVKTRMGDFVSGDLDKAMNKTAVNQAVGEVYRKYARGQTLIFTASVQHAKNVAAEIDGAVVVSGDTQNRAEIIAAYKAKKIKCLVNCMVFTEGTDLPLIETIIIARPTKNSGLYAQMAGRGLRLYEGKQYLTLIDCVGVSESLDICTAPSLMGLDIKDVPLYRVKKVEGMLTDMPEIVEEARESPVVWVKNVDILREFERGQGVNLHRVNWTKKSNGDLVYQLSCGDRIGVKAIDELGKTRVMYYVFNDDLNKFVYSESGEKTLQQALDEAYERLEKDYLGEKKFWDLKEYLQWQYAPATEKQIALIKARVSGEDFNELVKERSLTKGDAAQVINALMLNKLTPADLLRMHARKKDEQKAEDERAKRLESLKIRYILTKKGRKSFYPKKYYALQLPNDLIITDSWEEASKIIAENAGVKIRYKSFLTTTDAVAYLRGAK